MSLTQAQKGFIAKVGAFASADMKKSGVLASLKTAQAILESGWGTSGLAAQANALFGIKADSRWNGKVYSTKTKECYDGVNFTTVDALFRAYDNWEDSLADHSAFLIAGVRYAAVIGETDYKKACTAIHTAGYATDPGYAGKLINLIETYKLTDFDTVNVSGKEQKMNLRTLLFTNNACYRAGRTITPKGIMVHSTGANNPNLRRYVGPDDGLLGKNQYNNHWNQDKPDGRQVCVHGFIGKLANGSVATYQTLPWNHRGWHAGGDANNTHISFEICEDGLTDAAYFNTVYQEAVELCAYLCRMYNLDPTGDGVIIGHYEGHKRGIASNHGDPQNWFPKHGKSMDTFRAAVKAALGGSSGGTAPDPKPEPPKQEPAKLPVPAPIGDIAEGAIVEVKPGTENYYPGSKAVPAWVITDFYHRVTQAMSDGKPVVKGGKTCVLLGKKMNKKTGAEEAGINTWVEVGALTVVAAVSGETYTVQKGDTLWSIAAAKLGNGNRFPEIKTLNGLASDTIVTGQVLKIPKK